MIQTTVLRQLEPGRPAAIVRITAQGELGRRLRDMGLVPGAVVQILGRAPLNDPLAVKLRDCNLTLRNGEADCVLVEPR